MKSGIILLNKPQGITSFDCIRKLKKLFNRKDLGHGGTLDRFATGLLPVFFGEGLKLARFFLESYPRLSTYWKTYSGCIQLGQRTETGDPEGTVVESKVVPSLSHELVQEKMDDFVNGPYLQVPPKYCAKKIHGERSSDLVRSGGTPVLDAVPVEIRHFTCSKLTENQIYFSAECSKGTYMRALAEDLASKLGTVAFLHSLHRDSVGHFVSGQSISLEDLEKTLQEKGDLDSSILDMSYATQFLGSFELIGNEEQQIRLGKIQNIAARLANSGLSPNVYCAQVLNENILKPAALFELNSKKEVRFLRAFQS